MKNILSIVSLCALASCVSKPTNEMTEQRQPAEANSSGVGDIGSSEMQSESLLSYNLPLTRNGKKSIRVAYNTWAGEWPGPVVDVNARKKGTTKIEGYPSPRVLVDRQSCTVKNGLFHPWSTNSDALINYYSFVSANNFRAKKEVVITGGSRKITIPKDAEVINVVGYGENFCGATLKVGKSLRPITEYCDTFWDESLFVKTSPEDSFETEQWLHLNCEEKGPKGNNKTIFVQDKDLLSQKGIKNGVIKEYGKVGPNND